MKIAIFLQVQCTDQGTSPKFEFLKNNHKIDFAKKLFNYENTGRKKEAVKNIRKSGLSNKFALRWLSLSKPPHLV